MFAAARASSCLPLTICMRLGIPVCLFSLLKHNHPSLSFQLSKPMCYHPEERNERCNKAAAEGEWKVAAAAGLLSLCA